jgi:hypothetical protein
MEQRRRPQPTGEIQKALELVADQMVWNTADREAIPAEERSEGYTVWQFNNRRFYILVGGIGNEHWQELDISALGAGQGGIIDYWHNINSAARL